MNSRRNNLKNKSLTPVKISGKTLLTITPASGIGVQVLNPDIASRLAQIGDVFEEFRFTRLSLRPLYAVTGNEALAYEVLPVNTAAFTSAVQVVETGKSISWSSTAPNVLPVLSLNQRELNAGALKWWKYPLTSSDAELECQGQFIYAGTGTTQTNLVVEYDVEFRSPIHATPSLSKSSSSTSSHDVPSDDGVVFVPRLNLPLEPSQTPRDSILRKRR